MLLYNNTIYHILSSVHFEKFEETESQGTFNLFRKTNGRAMHEGSFTFVKMRNFTDAGTEFCFKLKVRHSCILLTAN